MATQTVMLQAGDARREFWAEFQQRIAASVLECNTIAGESIWRVAQRGGDPGRIAVERAERAADHIECSFDDERGILTCLPGPAIKAPVLRFEWAAGTLILEDRSYGFATADVVALILDELVTADEE